MPNSFVWFRYLVFALPQIIQVDSFVIFVGASSLVAVFTIIFVEVGRREAFTCRVWFDCLWSGFLFLLNISAASVVTALMPSQMCRRTSKLSSEACTSTKVLQGFTWLFTILLFSYFVTIFITVFIRSGSDSRLWYYSIYDISSYNRHNSNARLQSPPTSPMPRMSSLKRFIKPPSISSIIAPRPQRPNTNAVENIMPYAYRSGLSPDYQIEHFQFPARLPRQAPDLQRPPIAAGAGPKNLYPEYLRSSLTPNQPTQPQNTHRSSIVSGDGLSPHESPPPLGVWPRPDIMTQASRRSHRITPQAQTGITTRVASMRLVTESEARPGVSILDAGDPRSRPTGPRTRAGSNSMGNSISVNRPPDLDLSNLSTLRPNR
ncbi:hypothetical protein FB446DRAFT_699403 [Lentinula raphanica]|nr:hypothetical protein FB446DRAFT_699403 [Lentinula raphanica]